LRRKHHENLYDELTIALPVIPQLKLTDKGLFDAEQYRFIDVFEE
jgi:adenine deaminase